MGTVTFQSYSVSKYLVRSKLIRQVSNQKRYMYKMGRRMRRQATIAAIALGSWKVCDVHNDGIVLQVECFTAIMHIVNSVTIVRLSSLSCEVL